MGWKIRIGSIGFAQGVNADVITSAKCSITSNACHTFAQLQFNPNAGKTTSGKAGSIPACQAERAWQNVLSNLVGV